MYLILMHPVNFHFEYINSLLRDIYKCENVIFNPKFTLNLLILKLQSLNMVIIRKMNSD